MSDDVYYTMKRGWMDHPALMPTEPFSRAQAFEWLVSRASMNSTKIDVMGKTVEVRRGQLCMSYRALAEAWRWDLGKVQRFIARLKTDTLLDTESSHGRMMITICNYEDFDVRKSPRPNATDTLSDTRTIREQYAGDTQSKKLDDDNNAPAREEPTTVPPVEELPTEPITAKPGDNPNASALIQALTDEVKAAFGEEVGGMARPWTMGTDRYTADMFLNAGKQLGVEAGEVIDALRGHFQRQCRKLADKGRKPPKTLSMFEESGLEEIQKIAESRDRASRPVNGRTDGRPPRYANGDAPTSSAPEQPWQRTQRALMAAKLYGPAKELSAATAKGPAAANELAGVLEDRYLGKKPAPAAARAA